MNSLDLTQVCERYGAAILRRCLAILRDRQEAEDACQEVFISILTKGAQFRGEADVGTWIYRAATNHCLNRLRSDQRRVRRDEADGVKDWQDIAPLDPYEQYSTKLRVGTLLAGFDSLDQQIFIYRFLDGLTQEEIAGITGKSRKTIGVRLKRIEADVQTQIGAPS